MYSHWDLLLSVFGGALGGGVIAVGIQSALAWIQRPRISAVLTIGRANCVDTPFKYPLGEAESTATYVRVSFRNLGRSAARGCRVYLEELTKVSPDGHQANILENEWISLSWGLSENEERKVLTIPRGSGWIADIAFNVRSGPMQGLHLATPSFPLRLEQHFKGAGKFRAVVAVAGDNFTPAKSIVEFDYGNNELKLATIDKF